MILDSLKLNNGHKIDLKSMNLVIGPNNSGKSSFLKDMRELSDTGLILKSYSPMGLTENQIKEYMDSINEYRVFAGPNRAWSKDSWEEALPIIRSNQNPVSKAMLIRKWSGSTTILDGNTRLSIVNDKNYKGIDPPDRHFRNVFEILRMDSEFKESIQKYMSDVLPGKYFALWNPEQSKLRAYISNQEPSDNIEYYDSPEAKDFFNNHALPVSEYSDGIKAYLGILISIIADGKQQFLIDEPEAFLHPNLCFKLGKALTKIASESGNMCFCATHSPHFLKGCLSERPDEVSVTRFEFMNNISKASTLETEDIKSVIYDPLLNSIGVTEGLFHSRVIVTEGDSDRAFYSEINDRLNRTKKGIEDCLFINAQNKQTIAKVIKLYRKVSISCAAISDIDTIKEGGSNFSNILEALSIPNGTANGLRSHRTSVDQSLREAACKQDDEEITFSGLQQQLSAAEENGKSPREFVSSIRGRLKPPDYKKLGGLNLLQDQELVDAENLIEKMESYGWFVLRYGELEDWLPNLNVGTNKDGWLDRIFEQMGSDPTSNDYLHPPEEPDDVWLFVISINEWIS